MIHPREAWCIQIDITNACHLHCSNCTRLLDHVKKRFVMSPECFEEACKALARFPYDSDPCPQGRRKVVGMIGGEPLMHPQFPELVDIMIKYFPDVRHRGLWTSKDWMSESHPIWGTHKDQVFKLLYEDNKLRGYLNWNMHKEHQNVHHQPMLVSVSDVVKDEKHKWELIENCWVQREWSPTITDKGFFFCEVAGAIDQVFGLNVGLPITEESWKEDITFVTGLNGQRLPVGKYMDQINECCQRCGACVPMKARRDKENVDDVSPSNLVQLESIGSPRIKRGEYVVHTEADDEERIRREGWTPNRYIRGT